MRQSGDTQRRFCGDACRIQWWTDYRKANVHPRRKNPCGATCCGQALRADQKKYCSRACYLRAMEETHRQQIMRAWCGEEFSVCAREERQYCCRNFVPVPRRLRQRIFAEASGGFSIQNRKAGQEHIRQAAREAELDRDSKRVRLVCGETSMYAGIDSLTAIIPVSAPLQSIRREHRRISGSKRNECANIRHWDGQSFCQGKRRAQSGTYPWPDAPEGEIVEITEREFQYLRARPSSQ
ncbi:MAG: IS66 family insertion sequence element accessory protein TnpB [Oscillospiraceae bacterium]